MKEKKNYTVRDYLNSGEARMMIIVPLILYYVAFAVWGAGMALLVTAVYSGGAELWRRRQGGDRQGSLSIIALILVSGLSHYLYLEGYRVPGMAREGVFLSVSGALSVVVVFSFYSLAGRPVIRSLAEQAMPRMKTLPHYGSPKYVRVWQEVSLVWIVIYCIKACVVWGLSREGSIPMSPVILIAGWPLTIAMIAFSIRWPKYRWISRSSKPVQPEDMQPEKRQPEDA
ncbi:hypothetical protein VA7868_03184 [Vibrio aerogenes CECT 7868]|uniref:Intracellular septation protein A n=1 Tax=Vibrio aerogenes CECT 7868 TaxID=1216006 RepID=A0A1M5ZT12_9VIBR|nr:hypothetical protein [Vibrio aerogenes]SHI27390.1 hypothetical protein VA7868_03184 [Vibrio aerogenes CECT 7868]